MPGELVDTETKNGYTRYVFAHGWVLWVGLGHSSAASYPRRVHLYAYPLPLRISGPYKDGLHVSGTSWMRETIMRLSDNNTLPTNVQDIDDERRAVLCLDWLATIAQLPPAWEVFPHEQTEHSNFKESFT